MGIGAISTIGDEDVGCVRSALARVSSDGVNDSRVLAFRIAASIFSSKGSVFSGGVLASVLVLVLVVALASTPNFVASD